jgi:hypothetical protein
MENDKELIQKGGQEDKSKGSASVRQPWQKCRSAEVLCGKLCVELRKVTHL